MLRNVATIRLDIRGEVTITRERITLLVICQIVACLFLVSFSIGETLAVNDQQKILLEVRTIDIKYHVKNKVMQTKTKLDIKNLQNLYITERQANIDAGVKTELNYLIQEQLLSEDIINQAFDKVESKNRILAFFDGPNYNELAKIGQEAMEVEKRIKRFKELSDSFQGPQKIFYDAQVKKLKEQNSVVINNYNQIRKKFYILKIFRWWFV